MSKKLLTFFITRNPRFKKAVLYGGGSFTAKQRHGLHSGGFVCIVEAFVCLANLGGSCLHSRGSWRLGVPSITGLTLDSSLGAEALRSCSHAALNYKTEREPVVAAALGPLDCHCRSARPRNFSNL